jgi:cation diffusion facilitator CzcD-associated flavoprotein CzcO
MAPDAKHVTMLQRSPSYVISLPNEDPIGNAVRKVLPERLAHKVVRWKNVLMTMAHFQLSRRRPNLMRKLLRWGVQRALPEGYDVDTHFNPSYNPWDQRMCLVPDGDLFEAISSGKASIETDRIETFTEHGIRLQSGKELEADLVVTATGLQLLALGGMQIEVDGQTVEPNDTLTYKGMMVSDVPNFALAVGYTNASWTLKADLICQYLTRLINYMDEHGYTQATPRPAPGTTAAEPFLNLTSGYIRRSMHLFPSQGAEEPWRTHQNYLKDIAMLRRGDIAEAMEFRTAARASATAERLAA